MRQLSRRRQNRFGLCAQKPPGLDDDDDVGRLKLHNSSGWAADTQRTTASGWARWSWSGPDDDDDDDHDDDRHSGCDIVAAAAMLGSR